MLLVFFYEQFFFFKVHGIINIHLRSKTGYAEQEINDINCTVQKAKHADAVQLCKQFAAG